MTLPYNLIFRVTEEVTVETGAVDNFRVLV